MFSCDKNLESRRTFSQLTSVVDVSHAHLQFFCLLTAANHASPSGRPPLSYQSSGPIIRVNVTSHSLYRQGGIQTRTLRSGSTFHKSIACATSIHNVAAYWLPNTVYSCLTPNCRTITPSGIIMRDRAMRGYLVYAMHTAHISRWLHAAV